MKIMDPFGEIYTHIREYVRKRPRIVYSFLSGMYSVTCYMRPHQLLSKTDCTLQVVSQ